MSTPNPIKRNPSQQGRTPSSSANGPVTATPPPGSTPFSTAGTAPYHAFSPRGGPASMGPRSSPQQVKKSPASSANLKGDPAHVGVSMPLSYDSPSAVAAMGVLGLDISALDVVGVGGLTGGLGSDDEKLKRLDAVIAILSNKKGLVSEEGLERLARRMRLECLWEDTTHNGLKTKTLVIAGPALQIDIVLDTHVVVGATLSFPLSVPSVVRHSENAGKILFNDLKLRRDQSPLTKSLEKFAANLERLAELDKLSVIPGLDCHEALAGLYESLERLYEWDVARTQQDPFLARKSNIYMRAVVTCQKHGRPVMNARDRVGLGLQYWMQRRHTLPKTDEAREYAENIEKVWSLNLGCSRIVPEFPYTPLRISQDWISPSVEKIASLDMGGGVLEIERQLDWQEPPPTLLSSDAANDIVLTMLRPDGTLSTEKYPSVMFTASVEPPLVIPQTEILNLQSTVHYQPSIYPLPTFDILLFPLSDEPEYIAGEPRTITSINTVTVRTPLQDMQARKRTHRTKLITYRGVYAQRFAYFPFSHPRQLIEMLPILRQYAFVNTLLESSFGPDGVARAAAADKLEESRLGATPDTVNGDLAGLVTGRVDEAKVEIDLHIDVNLSIHPVPRFQVMFPMATAPNGEADISVEVRTGGAVQVVSQNVIPTGSDDDGEEEKEGEGEENTGVEGGENVTVAEAGGFAGGSGAAGAGNADAGDRGKGKANDKGKGKDKGKDKGKVQVKMVGGKEVQPHHLATVLETLEDLGKWCEWIRDRL